MPIARDFKETGQRFVTYKQEVTALFKHYGVNSVTALLRLVGNREFKCELKAILGKAAEAEGGKLTLTTVLGIIGAALGGVGIAAGGTAVGLPLALILGTAGYFAGTELDSVGLVKKIKAFFSGSGETPGEAAESDEETEQITSLLQELLARSDQADETVRTLSIKTVELEQFVPELRAKAERYEEEARQSETRVAALENVITEMKTEFARTKQKFQVLSWAALSVAGVALAGMFWVLMKR
jgi:hypothetical protein